MHIQRANNTAFGKSGRGVWKVDMVPNSDYDVMSLSIMFDYVHKSACNTKI
jgi:hypothetical protein